MVEHLSTRSRTRGGGSARSRWLPLVRLARLRRGRHRPGLGPVAQIAGPAGREVNLTPKLAERVLATPIGFEPTVSTVTGWRVRPLHYGAAGGVDRA